MKTGDLLFVYGTLRTGERADLSHNPLAKPAGSTRINGELYSVGWFPGVKLPDESLSFDSSQPTVTGDVFEVTSDKLVTMLDHYECYPSLFDRSQVDTEDGRTVWVYTYNAEVHSDSRIPSGDWCDSPRSAATRQVAAIPASYAA